MKYTVREYNNHLEIVIQTPDFVEAKKYQRKFREVLKTVGRSRY